MNEDEKASETTSFRLAGLEKSLAAEKIRIAHVLHTSLLSSSETSVSLEELTNRAPTAWRWVTARHPRMRARLSDVDSTDAIVYPTLSESALAASLVVLEEKPVTFWRDYVLSESHKFEPRTDTTETLFSMTLLPNSQERKLVLVLFSDHVFSDGFSGYVILRDFLRVLTNATPVVQDAEYHKKVPTSLPLQKPIFEQVIPRTCFRTLYDKFVANLAVRLMSLMIPHVKTNFRNVPKIPENQSCTQHFACGSQRSLEKALEICRLEKTTLMGPVCIAIALGIAIATNSIEEDTTHIKMFASVDYNLRNRVGMGDEHVGLNIGMSSPTVFNTPGLALEAPFWETARSIKEHITTNGDDAVFHLTMATQEHISHERFVDLGALIPKENGNFSDVNISNLKRWPFGDTIGPLSLEEVYVYHQISRSEIIMPVVFFVTSIRSLQYGMTSTLADSTTADTMFDTVVRIVESVGDIKASTTLREVLENVAQDSPTK